MNKPEREMPTGPPKQFTPQPGEAGAPVRSVALQVLGGTFVLTVLLVAGFALGVWFTQNYRIVPAGPGQPLAGTAAPGAQLGAGRQDGTASLSSPPSESLPSPTSKATPRPQSGYRSARNVAWPRQTGVQTQDQNTDGLLHFNFQPGEQLNYQLTARIAGKGVDAGVPEDVALDLAAVMNLMTQSVDQNGNAAMRLEFGNVAMDGNFMGVPFGFQQNGQNASITQNNKQTLDTSMGLGSITGIPQLEFFGSPIDILVSPNGQVRNVSGTGDIGSILSAYPVLSALEFPTQGMQQGTQWQSDIALPVPGFGEAPPARLVNTLVGYQTVGGRNCAVIQQDVLSSQSGGTLNSPKSSLSDAAQFSMSMFDLSGRNMLYFDVDAGKLVRSDMDLDLILKIGQALQDYSALLNGLLGDGASVDGAQLGDLLGGLGQQSNLVDLGLDIKATLALHGQ